MIVSFLSVVVCFIFIFSTQKIHKNADKSPIIAELIRQFDLTINIIQGSIEIIRSDSIGILFIEILGSTAHLSPAKHYLQQKNIDFEIIGYVK